MKTRFKTLTAALFLAVLFAAGNLSAKGTEVHASSHVEIEESIELENWMVNEYFWNENETIFIEEAQDINLEVESWMTKKEYWKELELGQIEKDSDSSLALENWMTKENIWIR